MPTATALAWIASNDAHGFTFDVVQAIGTIHKYKRSGGEVKENSAVVTKKLGVLLYFLHSFMTSGFSWKDSTTVRSVLPALVPLLVRSLETVVLLLGLFVRVSWHLLSPHRYFPVSPALLVFRLLLLKTKTNLTGNSKNPTKKKKKGLAYTYVLLIIRIVLLVVLLLFCLFLVVVINPFFLFMFLFLFLVLFFLLLLLPLLLHLLCLFLCLFL